MTKEDKPINEDIKSKKNDLILIFSLNNVIFK